MTDNQRALFIINRAAGTGYEDSVEARIVIECDRLGLDCTIEFTNGPGHAIDLARHAARERFERVYSVGGDGTVNEVAQGLLNTGVPMGILPRGSGNGLARHLGIPMDLASALSTLHSSASISMDTIAVDHRLSVNVSGIGFDGHIAGLFGRNGKRGLGGYAKLVLGEYMRYEEFSAEVKLDGELLQMKCFIIALANSSQYGNNATIAPHASVRDGWIDVCFIRKVPIHRLPSIVHKLFSGTLARSAFVELRRGKHLELAFREPTAFHIDGEPQTAVRHLKADIQPGSLRMVVPEHARARTV